jgi:hypothetical protein
MFIVTTLEIYPFDIVFIIDETDKNIRKWVKSKTIISDIEGLMKLLKWNSHKTMAFFGCTEDNASFIRLRTRPIEPKDFGYVQHEILHCIIEIFRRIGIKLTKASEEAYTYAVQYLTERFFSELSVCK